MPLQCGRKLGIQILTVILWSRGVIDPLTHNRPLPITTDRPKAQGHIGVNLALLAVASIASNFKIGIVVIPPCAQSIPIPFRCNPRLVFQSNANVIIRPPLRVIEKRSVGRARTTAQEQRPLRMKQRMLDLSKKRRIPSQSNKKLRISKVIAIRKRQAVTASRQMLSLKIANHLAGLVDPHAEFKRTQIPQRSLAASSQRRCHQTQNTTFRRLPPSIAHGKTRRITP